MARSSLPVPDAMTFVSDLARKINVRMKLVRQKQIQLERSIAKNRAEGKDVACDEAKLAEVGLRLDDLKMFKKIADDMSI